MVTPSLRHFCIQASVKQYTSTKIISCCVPQHAPVESILILSESNSEHMNMPLVLPPAVLYTSTARVCSILTLHACARTEHRGYYAVHQQVHAPV